MILRHVEQAVTLEGSPRNGVASRGALSTDAVDVGRRTTVTMADTDVAY